MILESASGPLIYRQRAQLVEDSYGDMIASWDSPEETLLRKAQVQYDKLMRTKETDVADGDTASTHGHLYYYSGPIDIAMTDRIRYGSEVWRIDGVAATRQSLGSGTYTHAKLIRFTSEETG